MNSSNSSTNNKSNQSSSFDFLLISWFMYIVFGSVLGILNSVTLVTMLKRYNARLGSLFFVGMSLADVMGSLAELISGLFRVKHTLMGETTMLTSRLICFIKSSALFIFNVEMNAILLIISSFDRLVDI